MEMKEPNGTPVNNLPPKKCAGVVEKYWRKTPPTLMKYAQKIVILRPNNWTDCPAMAPPRISPSRRMVLASLHNPNSPTQPV